MAAESVAAYGQTDVDAWISRAFARIDRAAKISYSAESEASFEATPNYQFNYFVFLDVNKPQQRALRWIIEKDGATSLIFFGEQRVPQYMCSPHRLYLLTNPPPTKICRSVDCRLSWRFNGVSSLSSLPSFTDSRDSELSIDLAKLIQELRADAKEIDGDPIANVVRLRTKSGSPCELHFSRERHPEQYPLKLVVIYDQSGKAIVVSQIYTYLDRIPATSTMRRWYIGAIPGMLETSNALSLADPIVQKDISNTVGLLSAKGSEDIRASVASVQAGLAARKYSDPTDTLSRLENQELIRNISIVASQSTADSKARSIRQEAIGKVAALLTTRIIEPVRVQKASLRPASEAPGDLNRVPIYVAGHERWRVRDRLESCTDVEIPLRLDKVLFDVAMDKTDSSENRIAAIDLMAELGSVPLDRAADRLNAEFSSSADADLRAANASFQIRTGNPSSRDVSVLREYCLGAKSRPFLRVICLESLLLADQTTGLNRIIGEVINKATNDPLSLERRCLFAACCSREGRGIVRGILKNGAANDKFVAAMFLAETGINADDPEWSECLEVAEHTALDTTAEMSVRIKASEIAWFGREGRAFQDAFIRQLLLEKKFPFLKSTGTRYLSENGHGQRYVNEFLQLVSDRDPAVRHQSASLFGVSCDYRNLTLAEKNDVVRLIQTMLSSSDPPLRSMAVLIYGRFRRHKNDLFLVDQLPRIMAAIRNEQDALAFAKLFQVVEAAFDKNSPINPMIEVVGRSSRIRTSAQQIEFVNQHRDSLIKEMESWLTVELQQ